MEGSVLARSRRDDVWISTFLSNRRQGTDSAMRTWRKDL